MNFFEITKIKLYNSLILNFNFNSIEASPFFYEKKRSLGFRSFGILNKLQFFGFKHFFYFQVFSLVQLWILFVVLRRFWNIASNAILVKNSFQRVLFSCNNDSNEISFLLLLKISLNIKWNCKSLQCYWSSKVLNSNFKKKKSWLAHFS